VLVTFVIHRGSLTCQTMYMLRLSDVARRVQKGQLNYLLVGPVNLSFSWMCLFQMNLRIRVINLFSLGFRRHNAGSRLSSELIGGVGFVWPLRHRRLYGRSRAYYTGTQFLYSALPVFSSSCMPRRQPRETAGGSPASY